MSGSGHRTQACLCTRTPGSCLPCLVGAVDYVCWLTLACNCAICTRRRVLHLAQRVNREWLAGEMPRANRNAHIICLTTINLSHTKTIRRHILIVWQNVKVILIKELLIILPAFHLITEPIAFLGITLYPRNTANRNAQIWTGNNYYLVVRRTNEFLGNSSFCKLISRMHKIQVTINIWNIYLNMLGRYILWNIIYFQPDVQATNFMLCTAGLYTNTANHTQHIIHQRM